MQGVGIVEPARQGKNMKSCEEGLGTLRLLKRNLLRVLNGGVIRKIIIHII
jgi:hypothetical protein